jgi:ATP-dependent exoDNAse (exonuclease V) alpha subunit
MHSPDDNSTPIELQEVHVKHGPVTRKQFPLVLAWGTTIHKAQGKL